MLCAIMVVRQTRAPVIASGGPLLLGIEAEQVFTGIVSFGHPKSAQLGDTQQFASVFSSGLRAVSTALCMRM